MKIAWLHKIALMRDEVGVVRVISMQRELQTRVALRQLFRTVVGTANPILGKPIVKLQLDGSLKDTRGSACDRQAVIWEIRVLQTS